MEKLVFAHLKRECVGIDIGVSVGVGVGVGIGISVVSGSVTLSLPTLASIAIKAKFGTPNPTVVNCAQRRQIRPWRTATQTNSVGRTWEVLTCLRSKA